MSRKAFNHARSSVAPHDHAVFVYDDQHELLVPLEHFLREGIDAKDLSVFVHSFPANDEAVSFLATKIEQAAQLAAQGHLAPSIYKDAFEQGGRIDHDHVASVVAALQENARASGRRAPRIFVDASRNYFDAGRVDEWFAFERWLGPRLNDACGLVCAYRASDLRDPKVLQQVLETHAYRFALPRRGAP